jgi:hypothetical protein
VWQKVTDPPEDDEEKNRGKHGDPDAHSQPTDSSHAKSMHFAYSLL